MKTTPIKKLPGACLLILPAFIVAAVTVAAVRNANNHQMLKSTLEGIIIQGTGYASPNNNHPQLRVVASQKTPDEIIIPLDSMNIGGSGNYFLKLILTGINEPASPVNELVVLGNPYRENAKLQLNTPLQGNYTLRVFDIQGKNLLEKEIELQQGNNQMEISGLGASGAKLIQISNKDVKYSVKLVQLLNSNYAPTIQIQGTEEFKNNEFKDGRMAEDSIILHFKPLQPELYNDTIITLPAVTQIYDYVIQQIPHLFTTTIKPFLETGEKHNDAGFAYNLNILWPDGTLETRTPDQAGNINLEKNLYPLNELGQIIISNDTNTYNDKGVLNWTLVRRPHQKTNRPNIAQNESANHMQYVAYETPVSLDGQTVYCYTIRKKATQK